MGNREKRIGNGNGEWERGVEAGDWNRCGSLRLFRAEIVLHMRS